MHRQQMEMLSTVGPSDGWQRGQHFLRALMHGCRRLLRAAVVLIAAAGAAPAVAERASCQPAVKAVRPVSTPAPDEFTIATQNLQRLLDDEAGGRGERVSTAMYQAHLAQLSAQLRLVLKAPAVLAVQEVENRATLAALAEKVRADGGPAYQVFLEEGPDYGGMDVGYLLRADIQVLALEPVLASRRLGRSPLFDRPPLRLQLQLPDGRELELLNVHLKSLRGSDNPAEARKIARKRERQAEALEAWLQAGAVQGRERIVLGDFNATHDGAGGVDVLARLQAAGFHDADMQLPEAERYSYVHDCRGMALDHVLLSPGLLPALRRIEFSRGNAGVARHARAHPALRSSDHDGLVLYLRAR